MRKTKIICTIGPASQSPEKIREMIEAGMNVCRCNFSHGSYEEQKNKMMTVVRISEEMKKPVATLIDTKGPEIRLRTFEEEKITLEDFFTRYSVYGFSVMDEVYGYNQTKYWGYITSNKEFYECIIEIYHLGDMIFVEE